MDEPTRKTLEDLELAGMEVRWEVRLKDPLWASPRGRRRGVRLHRRLLSVLRVCGEAVRALLVMGVGACLIPFAVLWAAGAVGSHRGAPIVLAVAYGLLLVCGLGFVPGLRRGDGLGEVRGRRSAGVLAVVALPLLMYSAAAPTALGLEGFERAGGGAPGLGDWLAFFGFMLVDTVTLGATQALLDLTSSLRPSSLHAAAHTFLVRALMTGGLIWAVWARVRASIYGTHEFTATVPELREWLKKEALESGTTVRAVAAETPLSGAAVPAGELAEVLVGERGEEQRSSGAAWFGLSPAHVLGVVAWWTVPLAVVLLLSAIETPIDEPLQPVAFALLWVIGGVFGAFLLLVGYGFAVQGVRWMQVVRRAGRIERIRRARVAREAAEGKEPTSGVGRAHRGRAR